MVEEEDDVLVISFGTDSGEEAGMLSEEKVYCNALCYNLHSSLSAENYRRRYH